jgi:hypothetical protein
MTQKYLIGVVGVVLTLAAGEAVGQQQGAQQPNGSAIESKKQAIRYNPPPRSAPGGRIGAISRGGAMNALSIEVLAPEGHVGFSSVDQPVLYYYLSRPVAAPLEITIDTLDMMSKSGPLLEKTLHQDRSAGIFAISLRDLGVRLAPSVTYQWSLAVIGDAEQRSSDQVASGQIRFVPQPASLAKAVAGAREDTVVRLFAENGYWYDAIATLSRSIDRRPESREQRAELLDQVGLSGPAALDRQARLEQSTSATH